MIKFPCTAINLLIVDSIRGIIMKKKFANIATAIISMGMLLAGVQSIAGQNSTTVKAATTAQADKHYSNASATITAKGYSIWEDSSWNNSLHDSTNWYHHSFKVSSSTNRSGSLYYRLSQDGQYFGMINADAVKFNSKGAQGAAIATNKYVSLNKKGYTVWGDFGWKSKKHSTTNWYQHTLQVKYTYYHSNGAKYYSLYQNGKWFGYLTDKAAKTTSGAQGAAIATKKYVKLSKKGYTIWGDFNWKNKKHSTTNWYNHVFQVKNTYYHNNGTKYYSLYQNGKWFGYLTSSATAKASKPVAKKKVVKKAVSGDTRTVYIAPDSGTKYHFDSTCRGLHNANSLEKMTVSEAQAEGYSLCGWED